MKMYLRLDYTKESNDKMLFSFLALHVAAAAVSHEDAVGGRRGREERAEHLCAPGAARVRPECCPWWRGTVCTWNIEMSTNTSPVKETEMNLKYQSLSKECAYLKRGIIRKKYIQACDNKIINANFFYQIIAKDLDLLVPV
jgi:hypothetical protein